MNKKRKRLIIAFQMDLLKSINIIKDSTFILMKEGYKRGNKIFSYLPNNLNLINGNIIVKGFYIHFKKKT